MPFTSYASIDEVAKAHQVRCGQAPFVTPVAGPLSAAFRAELSFTLDEMPYRTSESSVCEALIFPLLREVWKPYREWLTLWSHKPIAYDDDLCGTPDFILARRSPLGFMIFDVPYLLVVEAKKDDFERGWAQCLAAMLAAQKLHDVPGQTYFGISTNGRFWEFGRLEADGFTLDSRTLSVNDLDGVAGALHFVFNRCRDQAARHPTPGQPVTISASAAEARPGDA